MKRILLIIIVLFMFIPVVNAKSCDLDKIIIKSVSLDSSSDGVVEIDRPEIKGKNIKLSVSMNKVNDSINYKIVFQNESDEDYELDKNGIFIDSDYIDYKLESSDNSNVVKRNSTKEFYLTVQYKKEVPENLFINGSYTDSKSMKLDLSINDNILSNPNTMMFAYFLIIAIVMFTFIFSFMIFKKRRKMFIALFIISVAVFPISVFAVCKIEINIDSNIEIKRDYGLRCSGEVISQTMEGVTTRFFNKGPYRYVALYDEHDNQIGWNVKLYYANGIEEVTDEICSYINDIPITSTSQMFQYSNVRKVNLRNFNTSHVTDMSSMFERTHFENFDLSGLDTSNVEDMSYMFDEIDVDNLDLSSFNTSNVKNMRYMFYESKLDSIDLSSFDTSNVRNMCGMFGESLFTNINLGSFNTSNVENMDSMFYHSIITNLDLRGFDTKNVTNMTWMFGGSKIENLDLRGFNTSKVTSMKNMFSSAAATTIIVSNFDTSKVTDMSGMFANTKARELDLSSFDLSSIANNGLNYMFSNSLATVGYAKTQVEVDKLNSSSYKPSTLVFVVGPSE